MKKTRFTESQITGALKEHEAGKTFLTSEIEVHLLVQLYINYRKNTC
jgi:hypothetical protein